MINLDEIIRFQTDRELNKKEYEADNEHTNIIEELLETIGLDVPKENREDLKARFVNFVFELVEDNIVTNPEGSKILTVEDKVDGYADIIVFSVGAILKLGYDPEKVLDEVGLEINSRTGKMIDGKWTKIKNQDPETLYKANFDGCKRM